MVIMSADSRSTPPAALSARPTPAVSPEELAWVIVKNRAGELWYYTGIPTAVHRWSKDAGRARRFATENDAARSRANGLMGSGDFNGSRVEQHMWVDASVPPAASNPSRGDAHMTAPFRAPVPPSGEPTHDLYCNYCHRSLGVSPDARLVYCNALCEALWDEEHADPTSPAPVSEQAPPHFVCGPTCGCGKSYPMVVATNVFPACWTLPTHCPHCGKENVGNLHIAGSRLPSPIISIAPPAPVSGEPASSHDWPEDFAHENGRYIGRCRDCQSEFLGHKRRLTCKACAPAAVSLDGTRLAALLIDEANAIANWASELEAALSDFPRDEDLAKDVAQTRGDEAQLRALASRLQALLSDARRLDWLEANADRWSIRHVALSGKWLCDGADELLLDERFATMREAIDAASSVDRASQSAASTETTWQGQPKMREIL